MRGWQRSEGEVTQRMGEMSCRDYLHGKCHAIGTFSDTHVGRGVHVRFIVSCRGGMKERESIGRL